jgi:chromosome segregation ATPase
MEKIALSQVDKDSQWKEWQEKYTELQSMGPALSSQLLAFVEAHRSLKKTQSEFDEINERLNRRINEITEMNRLAEERFRQEWITFKADDQKRWTNYTLARDEETREDDRLLSQVTERLVALEDSIQDLKDSVGLITEETKKQLNGFYATAQELVESFNQSFRKRL